MPQDQYLRQNVVAQGNVTLGDDASDSTTVVGSFILGDTTVVSPSSAPYGPGPLTNEEIFSFQASAPGAFYDAATVTVSVVDDANDDLYMASFNIAHQGGTATLSSAFGVVDIWGGTDPTFNASYSAGTGPNGSDEVLLRMNIADSVSVRVGTDAKLYAALTSPEITIGVQPTNQSVTAPAPATFNVANVSTNDGGTLTYQWEFDDGVSGWANATGAPYSGDTTATLTVTDSTGLNGYQFRCTVTSDAIASPVTSNTVTLTVA